MTVADSAVNTRASRDPRSRTSLSTPKPTIASAVTSVGTAHGFQR